MLMALISKEVFAMKVWMHKHIKKILLTCHIMAIPIALFLRYLSEQMLSINAVCPWRRVGAQCLTCGGTHFVNDLLSGNVLSACKHNAFLFLLTFFFTISLIFVDLDVFFNVSTARKLLRKMYTVRVLIFLCIILIFFLIYRNKNVWLVHFW